MARMTEEEAWALDDYVTNNEITLSPISLDWTNRWKMRLIGLSNDTVNYLLNKAMTDHTNPAQIINELVGKERAASP